MNFLKFCLCLIVGLPFTVIGLIGLIATILGEYDYATQAQLLVCLLFLLEGIFLVGWAIYSARQQHQARLS